jgi:hypothetical protein
MPPARSPTLTRTDIFITPYRSMMMTFNNWLHSDAKKGSAKAYLALMKKENDSKSLYFIKSGEFIKIGVAVEICQRMRSLQTGNPNKLILLAEFKNCGHMEGDIHFRLSNSSVGGEWFRHTTEIDSIIEEISCKQI